MKNLRAATGLLVLAAASGCAYYVAPDGSVVPVGYVAVSTPASFDRSYTAAANAMLDEGLNITQQDRSTGMVVGRPASGGGNVTARISSNADGSVRVQFDGTGLADGGLVDRVSRSYEARMGR
jgi:hypothetical protein